MRTILVHLNVETTDEADAEYVAQLILSAIEVGSDTKEMEPFNITCQLAEEV